MTKPQRPVGEPVVGDGGAAAEPARESGGREPADQEAAGGREPADQEAAGGREPADQESAGSQPGSWTLLALILCAGIFAVGYRVLMHRELGQGAALFIGLPVILGTVVALATTPRSPLGLVLKVTTLCMCVLAPLLGEQAICLAMAAPLIFGVIGVTALILALIMRATGAGRGKVGCCALLVGLSPLLWEPAAKQPGWEDQRPLAEVRTSIDLAASPAAVWAALAESPTDLYAAPLPEFFRLRRHPGPRSVTGRGLQLGATRSIRLDNDQYLGTVTHSVPLQHVTFAVDQGPAEPGERIALWLRFVAVEFQLADRGAGHVQLTQITRYRRLLDPGFYFAPVERWGVRAMHRYTLALFAHRLTAATAGTVVAER